MKKTLSHLIFGLGLCGASFAQTSVTGPSSSQTPYLQPLVGSSTITSILTTTNVVGGYTMCGTPDGLGAFDNGNGTFTLLMNHEFGTTSGGVRAHGSTGAFVSKWVINKSNLTVVSGADLIQNVNLWTGTTYTTYNATSPSTLAAFGRFCSADLPAVSAYYNAATGKGTQERIFMNGEENGNEGRAFAHIATGSAAGNTYELPYLGKASFENQVASPFAQDKTIVVGMDDTTPGQVYVYVGNKTNTGTDIQKAGLTGGKLYGVAVLGLLNESSSGIPAAGTMFNLIDMGAIQNMTGATLNTNSNNVGVTNFLRPEDGAWDPSNPRDFYFATTNSFTSPSRVWRLRFNDITNPEQGGTIAAVLDGTEGQKMFDNLSIDHYGHMMLVEDVGGNAHIGKIWQYKIATDALTLFAQHDTTRFLSTGANFLTIDEEASGIIDVQEILGPGMHLFVDQAHYGISAPIVEGGQLLALYNPASALANPEINVQGNAVSIPLGNTAISANDNTDFGMSNVGTPKTKVFTIKNAGPGVLSVTSISIGGVNAGDFLLLNPPAYPTTIAVNGSLNITIQLNPAMVGQRNGKITVMNNDFDESNYSFAIQGVGALAEINMQGNSVSIVDGNTTISTGDNTDFGTVVYNTPVVQEFKIQNTGNGTLTVSGINLSGANVSDFTLMGLPSFPLTLAGSAAQTFSVQYLSAVPNSTSNAIVNVMSNDADEANYDFAISGRSMLDVGIKQNSKNETFVRIFPNPAKDEVNLSMSLNANGSVIVNVYDIQGKKVMTVTEKELSRGEVNLTLNTTALQSGEYFVEINANGKTNRQKLVVQH